MLNRVFCHYWKTVQAVDEQVIATPANDTIGTHIESIAATVVENNGGNALNEIFDIQPYDRHTETGQFIGNVITLSQGIGEVIFGLGTAGGVGVLTGMTAPACSTGIGCAIPATTATISATGLAAAAHGAGLIGNTIYNMSVNQGEGSRSGNSNADRSAKDYNPGGRSKVKNIDDARKRRSRSSSSRAMPTRSCS